MDDGQLRTAPLRLVELPQRLEQHPGFAETLGALAQGDQVTFDAVIGSSCALLATALLRHATGPLVVVCATQDAADRMDDDLRLFAGAAPLRFPPWESAPDERSIHDEIHGQRLSTLKHLHAWDDLPASADAASLDILAVMRVLVGRRNMLGSHIQQAS